VVVLVVVVLGGIYGGYFTATEARASARSAPSVRAAARPPDAESGALEVLVESARTTAMLFTLLIAATIFANFVNFTTMPGDLKEWITHLGLSPTWSSSAMMAIYVVLGTVMEELTMVLLTIPLLPDRHQLGFDPVWFGVLIVMIVQIGLISPPVGMNLFVINALLPDVGLGRSSAAAGPSCGDDRACWAADRLPAAQPLAAVADEVTACPASARPFGRRPCEEQACGTGIAVRAAGPAARYSIRSGRERAQRFLQRPGGMTPAVARTRCPSRTSADVVQVAESEPSVWPPCSTTYTQARPCGQRKHRESDPSGAAGRRLRSFRCLLDDLPAHPPTTWTDQAEEAGLD
jgi:hypothetical protein